ncbi:unnamed protein product, partial [Amoebophrya sp. A25]
ASVSSVDVDGSQSPRISLSQYQRYDDPSNKGSEVEEQARSIEDGKNNPTELSAGVPEWRRSRGG